MEFDIREFYADFSDHLNFLLDWTLITTTVHRYTCNSAVSES